MPAEGSDVPRTLGLAGMLYLDHATVELFAELERRGLGAVLLKGPAVARVLYPAHERRGYTDIDVLADPAQLDDVHDVLEGLGYRRRHPNAGLEESGVYAEEFVRKSAVVDLHRTYPGITVPPEEAWRAIRAEVVREPLRGCDVPMLGTPALALVLALHSAKPPATGHPDLDLAVRLLPDEDWRGALDLAGRLGALPMAVVGLRRAEAGDALLRRLGVEVELPRGARLLADGPPPPLAYGLERLATTNGYRAKFRLALRESVPSPDGLRYWMPLARRGRLGLLAAYAWRPLWLMRRLPRAALAWLAANRNAS